MVLICQPGIIAGPGNGVLLNDKPAVEAAGNQFCHEPVNIQVPSTQGHEGLASPHVPHCSLVSDHIAEHVNSGIFNMDMVDSLAPTAETIPRVPSAQNEMAGIQSQADISGVKKSVDLLGCLDMGARMVMEGGLETAFSHYSGSDADVPCHGFPTLGIKGHIRSSARICAAQV